MNEWEIEGDYAEFNYEGFICKIYRSTHSGSLCGYVHIPEEHKLYGQIEDPLNSLHVHGGITFQGELKDNEGFWIGFDCEHYRDFVPNMSSLHEGTYRNMAYVTQELKQLVDQIKDMKDEI